MTAKLNVSIRGDTDASLRFDGSEDMSVEVGAQPNLGTEIRGGARLSAKVTPQPNVEIVADAVAVYPSGTFEGPYSVTPTVGGFDVPTGGLVMRYDMTVEPIPAIKATNTSGGYTYTIA